MSQFGKLATSLFSLITGSFNLLAQGFSVAGRLLAPITEAVYRFLSSFSGGVEVACGSVGLIQCFFKCLIATRIDGESQRHKILCDRF